MSSESARKQALFSFNFNVIHSYITVQNDELIATANQITSLYCTVFISTYEKLRWRSKCCSNPGVLFLHNPAYVHNWQVVLSRLTTSVVVVL